MPDATGLELLAQDVRGEVEGSVLGTEFGPGERAVIRVDPATIHATLAFLKTKGYSFLASLHGVDYYPDEPRFGVLYELLDMHEVDRVAVKVRLPGDAPRIQSVIDLWPGANYPEREVYDMFGVDFDGHPDMRRILMPEDYEGHPQRRDFPIGGEPVLFTHNEEQNYGRWQ